MSRLDRRVQVLLDDARYRRVAARARQEKKSVGAVIRDAIDQAVPGVDPAKRAAIEQILAAEPMPVPETWDELKREIEEARARRFE